MHALDELFLFEDVKRLINFLSLNFSYKINKNCHDFSITI